MKYVALFDGQEIPVEISKKGDQYHLTIGTDSFTVDVFSPKPQSLAMLIAGKSYEAGLERQGSTISVFLFDDTIKLELVDARRFQGQREARSTNASGPLEIQAPMPGKIVKLSVKEQANVEEGDALLVMEAMKMQNEIKAPKAGVVSRIHVQEGEPVSMSQTLLVLE